MSKKDYLIGDTFKESIFGYRHIIVLIKDENNKAYLVIAPTGVKPNYLHFNHGPN